MLDGQPNGWAVLSTLISALAPIAATIVTYRLTRKGQEGIQDSVGAVHETVNGKSEAQEQRIAELEAHIEDMHRKADGSA